MPNIRHNADVEILQELKYHSLCKLRQIEPNHTCTIQELSENLKMTPRDLLKNLKQKVKDNIVSFSKIQSPKHKGKKRHVYTVIDKKFFESKNEIQEMWDIINGHLDRMRKIATKMRDRPAMKMHEIHIPLNLIQEREGYPKGYEIRYQYKYNKTGHEYLEDFCAIVNEIFSFIDSMTYASLSNTIDTDEKTVNVIIEIRIKTLNEISDVMEYIFKPYEIKLRKACYDIMLMRIPTYFMLVQLERRSKVMI